ncbi:hypothetical protein SERLADRAFT_362954 [Serpula lacrymans var. lacrymans S7.9]|uniref:Mitochondrial escape protein 2 n=1 Tax=Serpula lacrymans var. lacrymans (strain S7.9) TaxID=578457 RepID=F8P510_SERL9|nr:uncharacterized protein SERLADRAFT_362954 [Serpula lacrymans var. lacrymans S7.9]EGO21697.1 hypothetical protein SERLADRAFT_362954 [Serpula lacrymans var. lacrymans S7.9]
MHKPTNIVSYSIRHYIGIFREETLLERLEALLSSVKTHDFQVLFLEPHAKDGGVFVHFNYNASDPENALVSIENDLKQEALKHGGIPSWTGLGRGNIWLVKGRPWREDMNRYASTVVKLAFEGPDIQEESLYDILRPYGRIQDVSSPVPVPAGTFRSSTVTFQRVRSATIARNVIHGFKFVDSSAPTRLHAIYQPPIQAHAARDWITGHPRIVLPIIVFLLGTLTYTIFDPVRAIMVEGKILNWFNYREFSLYKWMRANTLDRLSFVSTSSSGDMPAEDVWKERKDAQIALRSYLSDLPSTIAFIHGPQGSGKSRMLHGLLRETNRKALVIDCTELNKASSDARLVAGLAQQTGYWPIFTFLNSMNSMIDLASVGIIGQKAGFSSSLNEQLKQILEVVGTALKGVSRSLRTDAQRKVKADQDSEERKAQDISMRERIRNGTWHDGRLDCVAGNGVMCELGVGDELMTGLDSEAGDDIGSMALAKTEKGEEDELARKKRSVEDIQAVTALPIVVIKNYAARGGANREELLSVLAQWAATLAENQIAHVIVMSDNRENSKLLARALPSKPLNSIALYDADASSALSFIRQRLHDAGTNIELTTDQTVCIGKLGGRASDLESLIHKVRSGQAVEEAVEDIIARGVGELRKNAFGEDLEDAKSLPWSREQAWIVLKLLSKQVEIPYYDLLLEFPFKGDELALRRMEHAELISINTRNGRPSTVRPGKPVLKYVFERVVNDSIFGATQDIWANEKVISSAENTVRACEQELLDLKDIAMAERSSLWGGKKASSERESYLFKKMASAETKIQTLEKQNIELKKVLRRGG